MTGLAKFNWTLIGAPTDVGAGIEGCRMGPQALRVAGLLPALLELGLTVSDKGDLSGPLNPLLLPEHGYRHLPQVQQWCEQVYEATRSTLEQGCCPMILGGDHSVAMGSIAAVADVCEQRGFKLRVLWLDAHADFNTVQTSPSGHLHGMPLAVLCGHGPSSLLQIGGHTRRHRAVDPQNVRLIGVRSVDTLERDFLYQQGVEVFDMRFLDEYGMRAAMQAALSSIDEKTHLHVSFDIDFLDPDIAPGVGTAVRGGPTYREAQLCMEMIADCGRLSSLDVMELNPARDIQNKTAQTVVELLQSLFGRSTLVRAPALGFD